MAKRPAERYAPGELEQTRGNLGPVSDEEARRLSQLLGGEVGVEKTPADVEERYQRLQDLNRRRSDRIINETPKFRPTDSSVPTKGRIEAVRNKPRYRDRVRIDFLAARPEHEVKTLTNAVATLFGSRNDFINPRLIINSDRILLAHIEGLVLPVRGLLALNRRNPVNRLRIPFYQTVLGVIKSWDIEGLQAELARLKISPRRLTFRYCGTFTRKLFDPIYRLIDIDAAYHLRAALKRVHDLDIVSLPTTHSDVTRIKEYFHQAVYEVDYIFGTLKTRLFPLLMKLAGTGFYPNDRFYHEARQEILAFLALEPGDLVSMPRSGKADDEAPEEVEPDIEEFEPVLETPKNQKGIEVLERLFPRAGWDRLDEYPDLYPYLHPFLAFPRGFELVRPDDPLQQTVILVTILHEFFYAYRHIQFGVIHETPGPKLGDRIQQMIESWRTLYDEFLTRSYLPRLNDFCRELERGREFAESAFGRKQEHDLLWQKKVQLLPHLTVRRESAADAPRGIPKLGELVSGLLDVLSEISVDLAGNANDAVRSIRNPWEPFAFDIETPMTRRLRAVMRRFGEDPNNANLLLYSFSILTLLDSLVNSEHSYFYPFPVTPSYRVSDGDGFSPIFNVPTIDSTAIIREAERELPALETIPPRREPLLIDAMTGCANEPGLEAVLEHEIKRLRGEQRPFSVVAVAMREFDEWCRIHGEEKGVSMLTTVASLLRNEVREFRDVVARIGGDRFAVLLPDTVLDDSAYLALRIYAGFRRNELELMPVIGLFEVQRTWSRDRVLRMIDRSAGVAAELDDPAIAVYDDRMNRFESLEENRERRKNQ
jgi:diguanylate cyclase (GGDEF)-like protein